MWLADDGGRVQVCHGGRDRAEQAARAGVPAADGGGHDGAGHHGGERQLQDRHGQPHPRGQHRAGGQPHLHCRSGDRR